jgi:sugar phosphate isomerase/epimerase
MQLGIFAKTFAGSEPALVLGAAKAAGYATVQFNLACAGLPSLPDHLADEAGVIAQIVAASRASSVSLCALSATYNMAHPDAVKRRGGLKGLQIALRLAAGVGIPLVTLCTGTRHASDQWAYHPDNAEPSAWADMAAEIALALELAEAAGVDLGIEPEQANIVQSTADARRLIEEMGSARLKIVFDPANLFEQASEAEAREIVARSIAPAAGAIAMVHAKDRLADGRFATAGTGVVDFADLLRRVRETGFDGPLVTHGLQPEEAPAVARFLQGLLP